MRLKTSAAVLLGAQLAVMIVLSGLEYQRYVLSVGFGTYAQAWSAIGQGHLNPHSTFIGASFWQNDAEFIIWPLAVLYRVYPHPIDLLIVQDIALVAAEGVAFVWILEVLGASEDGPLAARKALAWGSLLVIVVDPFAFETIAYDFHTEVIAALFVILAGRALWQGAFRQLGLWIPLALCCLALASMYVVALGVSGLLAGRRTRIPGALLLAVGIAYLVILGAVDASGFGRAHSLSGLYGYLVGPHHGVVRPADVVLGTARHPWPAISMVLRRWYLLLDFFIVFGLVGLWSVWTWPMVVAVMLPSALSAQIAFLNPLFSFQSWPTLMFILVGTVIVLRGLAARGGREARLGRGVALAWAVGLVVISTVLLPSVSRHWLPVQRASATELARLDAIVPRDAEVIASWGFAGRFATRSDVYGYAPLSLRFPVDRRRVFFVVVPGQGNFEVTKREAEEAVRFVQDTLRGRIRLASRGVYGIEWSPSPGVSAVTLPGPKVAVGTIVEGSALGGPG